MFYPSDFNLGDSFPMAIAVQNVRHFAHWVAGRVMLHWVPLLLMTAAIVLLYWPLLPLTKIASHLIDGDALHNAYLMNWGQKTLWTDPLHYYDAPMLYPQKTAAAFSSINLFLAFITGPLYFLGKPVFAYNAAMYTAVWLCGFSMYCSAFALTGNRRAALVAALLYCCNGDLQFHFNGHPNVVSPIFIPPLILISIRFALAPKFIHAPLFSLFLILQFLCDWYLGFIALIGVGVPLAAAFLLKSKVHSRELSVFLILFFLTMAFIYSLSAPFREVGDRVGSIRGLGSHINYSASLQGYFFPSYVQGMNKSVVSTVFGSLLSPTDYRDGDSQFYGWTLYLLLACAFGGLWWKQKLKPADWSPVVLYLGFVAITGFLFSMGPYFWLGNRLTKIPLPELLLFEFVPPLRFMRDTSRYAVLVVAALALLAALTLSASSWWNHGITKRRFLFSALLIGALLLEFRPATSPQFHAFNKEPYYWLEEDYLWAGPTQKLERVASIPLNNQLFLLQTTGEFPVTCSSYAGGFSITGQA